MALDTGASDTSIPTKVASDLGYDLSNPKHVVRLTTGSGTIPAKIVTVRKLTAIGETVQNIVIILQPSLKMQREYVPYCRGESLCLPVICLLGNGEAQRHRHTNDL